MHTLTIHPPKVITHGWLDSVKWVGGGLCMAGSALSPDGVLIDSFLVFAEGREFWPDQVRTGLPSPYMAKFLPGAPQGCESAGFWLRIEDPKARFEKVEDKLFGVLPRSADRDGHLLLRVESPSLSAPSEEETEAIGSWFVVGQEFLPLIVQLGQLQPWEHVLDVGCGLGRIAHFLAYYLESTARYEGFDIVTRNIEIARRNIATRHPNFRFQLAGVYNRRYNPEGKIQAQEFRFPYAEASFDVVLLTSVFTHMLAGEVEHYVKEVRRVLRPGGRVLATCFLLEEEVRELIELGQAEILPHHQCSPGCWVESREMPESAVAYDRDRFLGFFLNKGFELKGDYPGAWSGRMRYRSYQDLLIFSLPVR